MVVSCCFFCLSVSNFCHRCNWCKCQGRRAWHRLLQPFAQQQKITFWLNCLSPILSETMHWVTTLQLEARITWARADCHGILGVVFCPSITDSLSSVVVSLANLFFLLGTEPNCCSWCFCCHCWKRCLQSIVFERGGSTSFLLLAAQKWHEMGLHCFWKNPCVEHTHLLQTKQWKMHGARHIIVLSICYLWMECFPLQELAWLPSSITRNALPLVGCVQSVIGIKLIHDWMGNWTQLFWSLKPCIGWLKFCQRRCNNCSLHLKILFHADVCLSWIAPLASSWQVPLPEGIEKGLFVPCPCHCCFQQLSNWANLSADWLFDWKTSCLAG